MAVDAFITFENVSVGSVPEAFEIKDFSFGVENPTTIGSATGGAGAGKIKFNEFTIKKTSTVSMRRTGREAASREFLRFKFDTVFTTKIDWSGPGDEGLAESITFVYGKLGIRFTPDSGSKAVAAGWDQVTNKAADDFATS